LPAIIITEERVQAVRDNLGEIPFEFKHKFCKKYGMDISEVKIIFKNPWSLALFQNVVSTLNIDPSVAF